MTVVKKVAFCKTVPFLLPKMPFVFRVNSLEACSEAMRMCGYQFNIFKNIVPRKCCCKCPEKPSSKYETGL